MKTHQSLYERHFGVTPILSEHSGIFVALCDFWRHRVRKESFSTVTLDTK